MDLMFVNGTAFIINSAREIKILAIKHVSNSTAGHISNALKKVIKLDG